MQGTGPCLQTPHPLIYRFFTRETLVDTWTPVEVYMFMQLSTFAMPMETNESDEVAERAEPFRAPLPHPAHAAAPRVLRVGGNLCHV